MGDIIKFDFKKRKPNKNKSLNTNLKIGKLLELPKEPIDVFKKYKDIFYKDLDLPIIWRKALLISFRNQGYELTEKRILSSEYVGNLLTGSFMERVAKLKWPSDILNITEKTNCNNYTLGKCMGDFAIVGVGLYESFYKNKGFDLKVYVEQGSKGYEIYSYNLNADGSKIFTHLSEEINNYIYIIKQIRKQLKM